MARRPNPLVPLELFRSRAFATVNLATFFIYGALYVTFFYQAVILQGVLGYTALGAGDRRHPERDHAGAPVDPDRHPRRAAGARRFLVAGPLLMALGLLWYARIPLEFGALAGRPRRPLDARAADRRVHRHPAVLALFGLGISCVVAPLTSTLMGSISGRFSGLGSAINNSISRVGQPLLGALIFIVDQRDVLRVARLGCRPRHAATRTCAARSNRSTRRPPGPALPQIAASNQASLDAFHLAMLICAGLLVVGAAVSWYGLRERREAPAVSASRGAATEPPATGG